MDPNTLTLSSDEMRTLGYRVIDLNRRTSRDVAGRAGDQGGTPAELGALFNEPMPEDSRPIEEVLRRVSEDVFANMMHVDHPRFFAFVPSPSNFVSAMADALVAGFNPYAGSWIEGAGSAALETVILDWLRTLCGLPETAGGLLAAPR